MVSINAFLSTLFINKIKGFFFLIKLRIKDIFGTCCLKTLFFGISVSIRIADNTWVLGKDGYGTSVHFPSKI
jgi:hypothetical protein